MSPFDALLYRTDESPRMRSTLVATYLLERAPGRDELMQVFERASRTVRRLRQRVIEPTWPVFLPSWIVDPDFNLAHHLRFVTAAAPGTLQDLFDVARAEVELPLDRDRPLWTATLVEGLRHGRAGLVLKTSHAIADGTGMLRIFDAIFDGAGGGVDARMPLAPSSGPVTPDDLQRESLERLPAAAVNAIAGLARGALGIAGRHSANPVAAAARLAQYAASLRRVLGAPVTGATALRGRSAARRCAAFSLPLDIVRRAARATGSSINDVYLAGVLGALRRYGEAVGTPIDALPLAIPVNLRSGDEPDEGNYFGAVQFGAPVAIADPRERLRILRESVAAGRGEAAIAAPAVISTALARLPNAALATLMAMLPRPDVQASNVAGPTRSVTLAGVPVLGAYPFGPVPNVAAMFTMLSLGGTCYIGVTFDPAAITAAEHFRRSLVPGFAEVLKLGGTVHGITGPTMSRAARVARRRRA